MIGQQTGNNHKNQAQRHNIMNTFMQYFFLVLFVFSAVSAKLRMESVDKRQGKDINYTEKKNTIQEIMIVHKLPKKAELLDPDLLSALNKARKIDGVVFKDYRNLGKTPDEVAKARKIDSSFFMMGNRNLETKPDEGINRHAKELHL